MPSKHARLLDARPLAPRARSSLTRIGYSRFDEEGLSGVRGRLGYVLLVAALLLACLSCSAVAGAAQISSGGAHSCLVLSSGHVDCWGSNGSGQLGNGTTADSDTPVEVSGITDAVEVSAGEGDSCAVLSSGHIDCWGDNPDGALGNGSSKSQSDTPVEVQGIANAVQVAVGFKHSCAALSSGHVECWGDEVIGHIGWARPTPVEVAGIDDATQVAAGERHSCALLSSGHVECWEEDEHGQLGDGNTEASEIPVEVHGLTTATQIAAGGAHTCALLSSGRVSCWGDNEFGQLGDGTNAESDVPVEVLNVANATQLAAGGEDSCALTARSQIDCWGENFFGQLGDGTIDSSDSPVEVQDASAAVQVAAGGHHSCALLPGDRVECWGDNESEQLGNGTNGGNWSTPGAVKGLTNAVQIAVGYPHACAVLSGGQIGCWGENNWGQLGDAGIERSQTPVGVRGVTDAVQVAAAQAHSCAVLSSGHVECWGGDYFGSPVNEYSATPVEVKGVTTATQVATAAYGSCGLLSSGHVDCWGPLGDGASGHPTDTPVEVQGLTNAIGIAAGAHHSCALLSSGHVDCWGNNASGQLGDGGTEESSATPVEAKGISTAIQVAAGYAHSCALLSSGRVECWGQNEAGQLGDGTRIGPEGCQNGEVICSKTPVEVQGLTGATQVATGGNDSCALFTGGHADCWGGDESAQLGDGSTGTPSGTPVEVQNLSGAVQIAVNGNENFGALGSACALLSSGQTDCWGSNYDGALGNGFAWSTSPEGVVGFAPTGGAPAPPTTTPEPSTQPVQSSGATNEDAPANLAPQTTIHQGNEAPRGERPAAAVLGFSATASKSGVVSVTLTCRRTRTCAGIVSIATVEHLKSHRSKTVRLASAPYRLRGASSARILLTLSSHARALLAKSNVLHAIVTTTGGATLAQRSSSLAIHAARH